MHTFTGGNSHFKFKWCVGRCVIYRIVLSGVCVCAALVWTHYRKLLAVRDSKLSSPQPKLLPKCTKWSLCGTSSTALFSSAEWEKCSRNFWTVMNEMVPSVCAQNLAALRKYDVCVYACVCRPCTAAAIKNHLYNERQFIFVHTQISRNFVTFDRLPARTHALSYASDGVIACSGLTIWFL